MRAHTTSCVLRIVILIDSIYIYASLILAVIVGAGLLKEE